MQREDFSSIFSDSENIVMDRFEPHFEAWKSLHNSQNSAKPVFTWPIMAQVKKDVQERCFVVSKVGLSLTYQ